MAENKKIPYKIYLEESEMPTQWYNVRADMKNKPAPLLNPATLEPMKPEELEHVFCKEHRISIFHRRFGISIRCTVRHHWFVRIVWKKRWIRRRRFITNLREITHQEVTS